ncbi:MAG: hypothetical protein KAV82_09695, partial [Phycisphaerae bacterium]|nr:hypothetical protein [Phycisphaerae bacterium]
MENEELRMENSPSAVFSCRAGSTRLLGPARPLAATKISTATVREQPYLDWPLPYGRGTDWMAASFARFAKSFVVAGLR